MLSLWLCAPSLLDQGFRGHLACPSLSSLLWFCKLLWVLFSHMAHNLRDGVTPAGSRLVGPRSERRFNMFYLSLLDCFFVLSLPFRIWSPYGSGVGRFPLMHDRRLSWCFALSPSGWASNLCLRLRLAPCHYWRGSSMRTRVFGCPSLSPVFFPVPCYGYMYASMTLAPGLRLSWVPYP